MKVSSSETLVLFILSFFLPSISYAFDLNDFLHCLPRYSESSNPISEAIYTHENTSFNFSLNAYIKNRRFSTPKVGKPLAIVAAMHESHVQATVICARQHALQVRIRSGGHDYEGLSYVSNVPFIVVDLFNLRAIEINVTDESAWVESGATVGELYYKIAKESKVHGFPAGVCPTVGIGGHFSGGGYGYMMRKYGLTVDNIVDAKLVDVNGTIVDRKLMGEDLFWAIRGGGGASFGVILSWKIKLVRVPPTVTVFNVKRSLKQGALDVLYQWQQIAPNLPKEIYLRAISQVNKNGEKKSVEILFVGHILGQISKFLPIINKLFPELGLRREDCNEMSWVESTVFWASYPIGTPIDVLVNRTNGPTVFFKSKSDYVKKPIPKQGIKSLWKMMLEIENVYVQWNPYGGRMWEIPASATPFPHRAGNLFKIQYYMSWTEGGIETTNKYIGLSRKLYELMTPFVSKSPREAFLNYRDIDVGANLGNQTNLDIARVYGSKFFKSNFHRLVSVKSAVDPENFFRNEQSIPPL